MFRCSYSDFTGFGDIAEIVTHRAMCGSSRGLRSCFFAVQGLRRIPKLAEGNGCGALAFAFMCLAGAIDARLRPTF